MILGLCICVSRSYMNIHYVCGYSCMPYACMSYAHMHVCLCVFNVLMYLVVFLCVCVFIGYTSIHATCVWKSIQSNVRCGSIVRNFETLFNQPLALAHALFMLETPPIVAQPTDFMLSREIKLPDPKVSIEPEGVTANPDPDTYGIYGSFRELGVPYFGVLIKKDPTI